MGVCYVDVAVGFAVAVDDLFRFVADDDQFGRTRVDQVVENVFNERCAVDFDKDFRLLIGE